MKVYGFHGSQRSEVRCACIVSTNVSFSSPDPQWEMFPAVQPHVFAYPVIPALHVNSQVFEK